MSNPVVLAPTVLRMAVVAKLLPFAIIPCFIIYIIGLAVVAFSRIETMQFCNVLTITDVLSRGVVEPIVCIIIRAGAVSVVGTGIDRG